MKKPNPNPYPDLKAAIQGQIIISFRYITLVISVTILAYDLNVSRATLRNRLAKPSNLMVGEIGRLADLIRMDTYQLYKRLSDTSF